MHLGHSTSAVGSRGTGELVAIALGPVGIEAGAAAGLAQRVDEGRLSAGSLSVDILRSLGPAASDVLAAAFELTRRSFAPAPPRALRTPGDVAVIAQRELGGSSRERVIVIPCDSANRPHRPVAVSHGGVDRSLIPTREVLHAVLREDGRAFAVAHNHPSGDPEPSEADRQSTRELADAARTVGLRFLGHVVVADQGWCAVPTPGPRTPG